MASGPQLLTTELSIGPLAPNASVTVNHGITLGGTGGAIAPNIVMPDRITGIGVASVTSTQITFTNYGQSSDQSNFLVELEDTYQRDLTSTAVQYWKGASAQTPVDPVQVGGTAIDVYVSATTGTVTGAGTKVSPLDGPDSVLAKFPIFLFGNPSGAPAINIHYANSLNQWDDDRVGGLPVYSATATQTVYQTSQLWIWNTQPFNYMFTHRGPQLVRATGLTSGPTIIPVGNVKSLSTPAGTKKTRMTFGTNPGWTAANLKGRFARFINSNTGNQVIFEIPISNNAAASIDMDTVTINTQLTADLANMTVEICDPGFQLTGTAANFTSFDVKAEPCLGSFFGASIERCFLNGMQATSGCFLDRCLIAAALRQSGDGWGWFNCSTKTDGTVTLDGMILRGGSTGSPVVPRADTVSSPEDPHSGFDLQVYQGLYIGTEDVNFTFQPLFLPFFFTVWRGISVYDSAQSGLSVGLKSMLRTSPQMPAPLQANKVPVQGGNNAADGWMIFADGLVIVDSPSGNAGLINLTGTQGDIFLVPELAGTPNGIRYGTGVGQFEEAAGWAGNYTHILSATSATAQLLGSSARMCTRAFAQ